MSSRVALSDSANSAQSGLGVRPSAKARAKASLSRPSGIRRSKAESTNSGRPESVSTLTPSRSLSSFTRAAYHRPRAAPLPARARAGSDGLSAQVSEGAGSERVIEVFEPAPVGDRSRGVFG